MRILKKVEFNRHLMISPKSADSCRFPATRLFHAMANGNKILKIEFVKRGMTQKARDYGGRDIVCLEIRLQILHSKAWLLRWGKQFLSVEFSAWLIFATE